MAFYRYWSRQAGALVILVKGAALERLLNLASMNGIYLWDIRRYHPDLMVANIGIGGFRALRPLLRRTHCRVKIKRKYGLPFVWRRLTRRPGFICGFLLCLSVLVFLTSFVWRIELVGLERIPAANIRRDLKRLGLYEGVFRGRLDKDQIQRDLELLTPEAVWIGIEIRGMAAVVRVVERVNPPAQPSHGDLVAARDGLIAKAIVYRGTAAIIEGQTVHAGQLLVSGSEVGIGADGSLRRITVPASARIEARIWEEARTAIPLTTWELAPTGKRVSVLRLRVGRRTFSLGPRRPPFVCYQLLRTGHGLGQGRNTLPLVEVVIDRYHEVRPIVRRRSEREASALGVAEARALLDRRLPPSKRNAPVQLSIQNELGFIHVMASGESLQEIAVPVEKGADNQT